MDRDFCENCGSILARLTHGNEGADASERIDCLNRVPEKTSDLEDMSWVEGVTLLSSEGQNIIAPA